MKKIVLFAMLVGMPWMAQGARHRRAELRVEKAFLDANMQVHLQWKGQAEQVMERDHAAETCDDEDKAPCTEVSASQLTVSADRRSVGWTAEYNECCQTYAIPFVLVIARDGHVVQRIQVGLGIFDWRFVDEGRRVALFSNTAHGNVKPTCALYDVRSGREIETWYPGKSDAPPVWAKGFEKDLNP